MYTTTLVDEGSRKSKESRVHENQRNRAPCFVMAQGGGEAMGVNVISNVYKDLQALHSTKRLCYTVSLVRLSRKQIGGVNHPPLEMLAVVRRKPFGS